MMQQQQQQQHLVQYNPYLAAGTAPQPQPQYQYPAQLPYQHGLAMNPNAAALYYQQQQQQQQQQSQHHMGGGAGGGMFPSSQPYMVHPAAIGQQPIRFDLSNAYAGMSINPPGPPLRTPHLDPQPSASSSPGRSTPVTSSGHSPRPSAGRTRLQTFVFPRPQEQTASSDIALRYPLLPELPTVASDEPTLDELRALVAVYEKRDEMLRLRTEAVGFEPRRAWRAWENNSPESEADPGAQEQADAEEAQPVLGVRLLQRVAKLTEENDELGRLLEGRDSHLFQELQGECQLRFCDDLENASPTDSLGPQTHMHSLRR